MFRHPRNIIRDPEEVDRFEEQAENAALRLFRGEISQNEYFGYLNEMNEYLDFRRLAAEMYAVKKETNKQSVDCDTIGYIDVRV
jgi:hypothetical protein